MTPAEASEILTIAAAFDRRTIGKADAIAWADALAGLDVADCARAVRAHFQESTDYLMPVHVRRGVRTIRAGRVKAANAALLEPHDVDPDDVPGYLKAKRQRVATVAAGLPIQSEPVGIAAPERVERLIKDTLKALPKMPTARPVADLRDHSTAAGT